MKQHDTEYELDRTFQRFEDLHLNEIEKKETYRMLINSIDRTNKKAKLARFFHSAIPVALTTFLLIIGGLFGAHLLFTNEQVVPGTELMDEETAINELKPTDFYEFRLVAFFEEIPYESWSEDESLDPELKRQFQIYEELMTIDSLDRLEEFHILIPDSEYVEAFGVTEFPTFIGFDHTGIYMTTNELEDVESFMDFVQQQQSMSGAIAISKIEDFPYDIKKPAIMPFEPTWTQVEGSIVPYRSSYLNIDYSDEENRMQVFILSHISIEDPPGEHELPRESFQQVQLSDGRKALYILDGRTQVLLWDDGELNYRIIMYLDERDVEKYTIAELVEIADSFE
ncbi:hypothetical protein H1D32_05570 [Anaerobacillus sp. CMMVII]|uniref:hypothetical protein n=1 Tax=Anaerobacillus sp. CMMVII TaxID=2755588 RepID=UPI0021B78419|nr:hypothetical protein [Anaerobacillus sp. CMMVII]MCT8137259.1 hypothetical protein [Anaerobacillus sp. CMMVII]